LAWKRPALGCAPGTRRRPRQEEEGSALGSSLGHAG